jgi:molybdenum cofactor synthesis domain-containing protein
MAVPKRPWLEWEEALARLLAATVPLPVEYIPLNEALGRRLAEPVRADRDLPPFDRATMDGYAVRSADLAAGPALLPVTGLVAAGTWPGTGPGPGEVWEIYTGAPLPPGADAVVPVEETEAEPGTGRVRLPAGVAPGTHVDRQGGAAGAGSVLLGAGGRIGPAQITLLAAVGHDPVAVGGLPRVHLAATGDELVDHREVPTPACIRDSSSPTLTALLAEEGVGPVLSLRLPDEPAAVADFLRPAAGQADLVLVTGGVSAGARDHVEEVLLGLGGRLLFDAVRLKPGKPCTAVRLGRALVLGLPGNPVSSFVAARLFVQPVLRRLAGAADPRPRFRPAELGFEASNRGLRPELRPVHCGGDGTRLVAGEVPYRGSGDVAGLALGNAFALLPAEQVLPAGRRVAVLDYRDPPEGGLRL